MCNVIGFDKPFSGAKLEMIEIDGCHGEAGGQLLRTVVALAPITGQKLRVRDVRAAPPLDYFRWVYPSVFLLRKNSSACFAGTPGLNKKP